jgi:polysaccharide export outer membrane protein
MMQTAQLRTGVAFALAAAVVAAGPARLGAQAPANPPATTAPAAAQPGGEASEFITPPADYVIGVGDSLSVKFWKDNDMSADVVVRPDGLVTLPLINDMKAAGLTPEQLRTQVTAAATKFVEAPNVQVYVRDIKSRQVFITGMINRSAPYPLLGPMTVMQLIAMAGGLQDFADGKNIVIIRTENGEPVSYRFNYNEVMKRKNLKQNIELKPGDTVIVP